MSDGFVLIRGLEELESHLQQLLDVPDTKLDERLIDEVDLQITGENTVPLVPKLLPNLTKLLYSSHSDPTPLCNLITKLITPLKFTTILTLASEDALIGALRSPNSEAATRLVLTIIGKASATSADVAILSVMRSLVVELISTWLAHHAVGIGDAATFIIGELLTTDCDHGTIIKRGADLAVKSTAPGQGLLWRRIFHDVEIYGMIYEYCSPRRVTEDGPTQFTLAQARLLRLLTRISVLDFPAVSHSMFPAIDARHMRDQSKQGLLYWAVVIMVDRKDYLMHLVLIDFWIELLLSLGAVEMKQDDVVYLANMLKDAIEDDEKLHASVKAMTRHPETSKDVLDLLHDMQRFQDLDLPAPGTRAPVF